ncbi:hypothetical protein CY34DRAFT_797551 [Suillus luteus UH-Slu-Lm8-n1]|uniref:Uncharacterized protein n=1 Tax=Suillus luteus UH-Slu-Lm8-n1 TaxID=930992 RepID=A0A0D0BHR9_9AGAM|nr:hypothetical protein CY34DRAFT_797551 [Suillus luteus UH-Slu-Lm8-n1]
MLSIHVQTQSLSTYPQSISGVFRRVHYENIEFRNYKLILVIDDPTYTKYGNIVKEINRRWK